MSSDTSSAATPFRPRLWVPGDWNAFFGFGTNILVNLLTLTALLRFVVGFPDALVFGRIGDLVGRKNTFLVTMLLMGLSTFVVGLLPPYAVIGIAAPIILVLMRLIQGLALGGEYGGAATYVAEHAPEGKRGLFTSFIQTTATLGLFAALLVVIGTRTLLGEEAFADWGWRHLRRWVIPALDWVGLGHQAFIDLRTDTCARFNEETPDVPGVRYYSVAGLSVLTANAAPGGMLLDTVRAERQKDITTEVGVH